MFTTVAAAALLALVPTQQQVTYQQLKLKGQNTEERTLYIWSRIPKIEQTKISPLHEWPFEYIVAGYVKRDPADEQYNVRFQVYSQIMPESGYLAPGVTRSLLRLWEFNWLRFGLDHDRRYYLRSVDVYLSLGGEPPGAEQLFDQEIDPFTNETRIVNTIYVYQVQNLNDPLQAVRELAHEYGHATLPLFAGTYTAPERFPNGDLGERLYMLWIRDALAAGVLEPADFLGVTVPQLDGYIAEHVTPMLSRVASEGPDFEALRRRDSEGYFAWVRLALYGAATMPHKAFYTALKAAADTPETLASSMAFVAAGHEEITFRKPAGVSSNQWWIPLEKGTPRGAKVIKRSNGWAKIETAAAEVVVANPSAKSPRPSGGEGI